MNLLVIDDERELRESIASALILDGHQALQAGSAEEGLQLLKERGPDTPASIQVVLLDVQLPGLNGLEALKQIQAYDPTIKTIVITAHANVRDAVEAMREGAYNYLEKPLRESELIEMVNEATVAHRLIEESQFSSPSIGLEDGRAFIGKSSAMREVFELIHRLGKVNTSVLIQGENGTGKELVARAIHFNSPRKDKPFVAINCGAIPEGLVESELFGHEKGAFTGAESRHTGKLQAAEGGTLFLDEVGELPLAAQVKLLRVLQERRFSPLVHTAKSFPTFASSLPPTVGSAPWLKKVPFGKTFSTASM